MLLNMIDGKIGPLLVLYHTKAHTAFEDGAWSINKEARQNRLVPPRPTSPSRKDNLLLRIKGASRIWPLCQMGWWKFTWLALLLWLCSLSGLEELMREGYLEVGSDFETVTCRLLSPLRTITSRRKHKPAARPRSSCTSHCEDHICPILTAQTLKLVFI